MQTLEQLTYGISGLVGSAICERIRERMERFGTFGLLAFGPTIDPSAQSGS